jgi:hypothetical protein
MPRESRTCKLKEEIMMSSRNRLTLILVLALSLMWLAVAHARATRVSAAIWGHGQLYDTVITPATFVSPPEHSTDAIYSFDMSGLKGQRAVADAAPGDRNYNGGRWSVQMAVFTDLGKQVHDADGDGYVDAELESADQVMTMVDLGHIESFPANFYFECPMLPRRR